MSEPEPTIDCAGCGDPAHTGDYVFSHPDGGVVVYHFDCLPDKTTTGVFTGIKRTARDLEGSILGEVLEEFTEGVYVAPTLGVNFVEPWVVVPDAE